MNIKRDMMFYSWIALMVAAAILFLTVFMPFITLKNEDKKEYENHKDEELVDGVTAGDMIDISMMEYGGLLEKTGGDKEDSMSYTVVATFFAVLALVSVVCAFFKKPILSLIASLITLVPFMLYHIDFSLEREIVGDKGHYNWGIGYTLYYVALIAVIALAVWMVIEKRKAKAAARVATESVTTDDSVQPTAPYGDSQV